MATLARCSIPTARKTLLELEKSGFISRKKNYTYDEGLARLVYTQSTYRCDLSFQGGFTLIPWGIFGRCLKRGAFLVCAYTCTFRPEISALPSRASTLPARCWIWVSPPFAPRSGN